MHVTPTGIDFIAAIIAIVIGLVSLLTLLGMGLLMAIGAVLSKRPLVTSWPTEQEMSFESFERRSTVANAQAWTVALIGAVVVTLVASGIYFGVSPEHKDLTKDMNMSNLTKKRPAATKSESAAPAEAPKAESAPPAEAPKSDTPAAEAPKQ